MKLLFDMLFVMLCSILYCRLTSVNRFFAFIFVLMDIKWPECRMLEAGRN